MYLRLLLLPAHALDRPREEILGLLALEDHPVRRRSTRRQMVRRGRMSAGEWLEWLKMGDMFRAKVDGVKLSESVLESILPSRLTPFSPRSSPKSGLLINV